MWHVGTCYRKIDGGFPSIFAVAVRAWKGYFGRFGWHQILSIH